MNVDPDPKHTARTKEHVYLDKHKQGTCGADWQVPKPEGEVEDSPGPVAGQKRQVAADGRKQ